MDESVIFVQELRGGDDDICVFETEETNLNLNSRGNPTRQCKKPNKPIPLIDLSRDSGNFKTQGTKENVDWANKGQSSMKINKESNHNSKSGRASDKAILECPVCLDPMLSKEIKITNCGHLFCKDCMEILISQSKPNCPKCRNIIVKTSIRRVFL